MSALQLNAGTQGFAFPDGANREILKCTASTVRHMRHIDPAMAMKRGRKADYFLSWANRATMRRKLSDPDFGGCVRCGRSIGVSARYLAASMAGRTEY